MKSFFLLILLFINFSPAQNVTGNLEGRIVDTTGTALKGVNISLQSKSLQGIRGTSTDEDGFFRFLSLPTGIYQVKISLIGHRKNNIENVQISLGRTAFLGQIKLEQEAIDLPEITILENKFLIDQASTTNGGNLRIEDFENLPIERNYRRIAALIPQANISYYGDEINLAGGTGNENKYFVDGVEVTDPMFGNSSTNLPYNFIKEIEVKTGGYEAEFRSSLGGIINVITNSGSNEIHGSAWGFYTNNSFSANKHFAALDPLKGDFSDYDIGLSIGGPIVKDILWYYAAYNPGFVRKKANIPGFGERIDKNFTHSFAAKISWKINDKLKLNFTGTGDPTYRNAVGNVTGVPLSLSNIDPFLTNEVNGGINLSVHGTYLQSNNLYFEMLYSNTQRNYIVEPATERGKNEILFIDNESGNWSGGVDFKTNEYRFVNTLHIAVSLILDHHRIKAGFEYKDNANYIKETNSRYINRINDTLFTEFHFKNTEITVHNRIPSFFIQDSWQIFSNLNLNIGLRFEGQFLVGSKNNVNQKIISPAQPRIGFVYLPEKEGSGRIYGSFGRYTQDLSTMLLLVNYSENGYRYLKEYNYDPRIDLSGGIYFYNTIFKIANEISDLQPQYFDEFTLGYEHFLAKDLIVKLQGNYRILREAIEDMWISDENKWRYGNPGSDEFSDFPKPKREYSAMTLSVDWRSFETFYLNTSYVLSRNYGNYPGLFDAYTHRALPNRSSAFNEAKINAVGLLPNDVTHIFKLNASYYFLNGFYAGITFTAQSGTPLNQYANYPLGIKLLTPRGSAGRTPSIWDLNLRLSYEVFFFNLGIIKLLLDAYDIGSQKKAVDINQVVGTLDTNEILHPSASYGQVLRYQQPISFRLGMEVNF